MGDSDKDEVPLTAKSGVEARVLTSLGTPSLGDAPSGGLRLCKTYVDKVNQCCYHLIICSLFFMKSLC